MDKKKVTKIALHTSLFVRECKDFGRMVEAGTFVDRTKAKVELAIDGNFVVLTCGPLITELIPLANVISITLG